MCDIVKCPFCDCEIENDVEKCPNCNALFTEPHINNIKIKSFSVFVCLQILTFGLFSTIWFFINRKAINNYSHNQRDVIKYNVLLSLLLITILAIMLGQTVLAGLLSIIAFVLNIALTYRTLKIIQKYTTSQYNAKIEFNPYYVFFFQVLYLIHFIDTYPDRVINNYEPYNFGSIKGVLILILLVIICPTINYINGLAMLFRLF